jgi:hypothetical protein
MHHPPDGTVDPAHHPRTDEGRAAPGRGRVLDRRDDPDQADRRARSAGRAAAGAGPSGRWLGAGVGDLRARHHRRRFVREVAPGEMVVITEGRVESYRPFEPRSPRFCIFEHVYFSRPDSILGGRSVYETRHAIGAELAREAPVRGRSGLPGPRFRARLRRSAMQPGIGHALWHGDRPQPVCRAHLHRTHRADPQHGRAAEAQHQPRAGGGQTGGAGRRFGGARHDRAARSRK